MDKKLFNKICDKLEQSNNIEIDVFTVRAGNIEIWIANSPVFDTNFYPVEKDLSITQKYKLYKLSKRLREKYILNKIKGFIDE